MKSQYSANLVYNIIFELCKYSGCAFNLFVYFVNQGMAGGKILAEAIRDAIRYCIEHDIMREFLEENGVRCRTC